MFMFSKKVLGRLKSTNSSEQGMLLVTVIIVLGLCSVVSVGMLNSSKNSAKVRNAVKLHSTRFYEVEESVHKTMVWLRENSDKMFPLYEKTKFETHFAFGDPSLGTNEGVFFKTPTMMKIAGTTKAPMLSNNDSFGTPFFPNPTGSFNPVNSFKSADLGPANVRLVMVWAQDATTHYEPIYRLDAMTGNNPDRGVHMYSYIFSAVGGAAPAGFIGKNKITTSSANSTCYSFKWVHDGTNWVKSAPRANCNLESEGDISLKGHIYGKVTSTGSTVSPHEKANEVCEGSSCASGASLPDPGYYPDWKKPDGSDVCPGGPYGDLNITSNTTLGPSDPKCYDYVKINNGKTLTLTDSVNPYGFNEIDISGTLKFGTIPPTEKVTIYTQEIVGYQFSGSDLVGGGPNAPHQVEIYYTSDPLHTTNPGNQLLLNGGADIFAMIYSPYAPVHVKGNFVMNGVIQALDLKVTGKAKLELAEAPSGGASTPTGVTYSVKKASQSYR